MQKTIELASNERYLEIVSIIKEVCEKNLNKEYLFLAENLCKELFKSEIQSLNKGKTNSWACGIVHAIGLQNNLFNNKSDIRIKAQDFYKLFNVSSSTGLLKSKEIRSFVNIEEDKWLISNINKYLQENVNSEVAADKDVLNDKVVNKIEKENKVILEVDEELKEANSIIKKALKEKNYNKKVKIAKDALRKSSKCVDAYIILSNNKQLTNNEKLELLKKAVYISEEIIGKDNIKNVGEKDLNLDVIKSYIKVKYEIAKLLWNNNQRSEAINELKLILETDNGDELLIRGTLITWSFIEGMDEEVSELLSKYSLDKLIDIRFTKVLYLFKANNLEDAERALRIANSYNDDVLKFIIKLNRLPKDINEIKGNSKEELAARYYEKSKEAWDNTTNAVDWVKEVRNRL